MRWGKIGSRITSAPTGLFGSHYAFSDTVPGKSLSSDVLFIFVQTNMALRKYTCFSSPVWSYRRSKNRRGSGARERALDLLYVRCVDPLHASNGPEPWRGYQNVAFGMSSHFPQIYSAGLYDLSILFLQGESLGEIWLCVIGGGAGAYYTVEYR